MRIEGSLPDPGDDASKGLIFAGGWGVEYDFSVSAKVRANQPHRLAAFGFPPPFDRDLEGALRGRGGFSQFLYLFRNGRYLRLDASTLQPDGPADGENTAAAWNLPADWVDFDAVLPGRGKKIDFCYFFRGAHYIRFDWKANAPSDGYPKLLGPNWHMPAPFDARVDGVIAGQGTRFASQDYVFATVALAVDKEGNPVPPGGDAMRVNAPAYARYHFDDEALAGQETEPRRVTQLWEGLLPLLDAGAAIDTALPWCDAALAALSGPVTPALSAALGHHFMNPAPSQGELDAIIDHLRKVRDRLANLPVDFRWRSELGFPAQTSEGTFTEIGDAFSNDSGPMGRAAILIHEAVHFIATDALSVDVPEWSGEIVNGVQFGVSEPIPDVVVSGIPYRAPTTMQAIENPSSYAAFAQEMFFSPSMPAGSDTRFGFGRPHE